MWSGTLRVMLVADEDRRQLRRRGTAQPQVIFKCGGVQAGVEKQLDLASFPCFNEKGVARAAACQGADTYPYLYRCSHFHGLTIAQTFALVKSKMDEGRDVVTPRTVTSRRIPHVWWDPGWMRCGNRRAGEAGD